MVLLIGGRCLLLKNCKQRQGTNTETGDRETRDRGKRQGTVPCLLAVDLSEEKFKYDKSLLLGSGRVEGIRFVFRDVHLFIFALEYNLVLTKSKYDLFCEKDTSVLDEENEAKLRIRILR